MADNRTTNGPANGGRPGNGIQQVKDGSSNTVVVGESPNTGASGSGAGVNEVVVIADRNPATGETTLVEGKSTGGDGPVQVSGTNLTFEDKAEFNAFLSEVNAKEDAGVPFEEILGNDVNAIPVVENGRATGETLGGIVTGPPVGGEIPVGANGSGDSNAGADNRGPVKDGAANANPFESPAGGGVQGESLRGPVADRGNQPANPAPGSAGDTNGGEVRPGRDANGNLLPGAEGRVNLDDFNRINDRDGNGINDGIENPVDLSGGDDAPRNNGAPNGNNGAAHGDNGGNGRQPGRDAEGNLLPGAEGRVTLDDFVRINDRDGNGVIDGIENPVDLRGDRDPAPRFDPPTVRPGLEIPTDIELPGRGPTFEPGGDGTPDIPGRGPTVVVDPILPVAPQAPGGYNDGHGNNGGTVAEPPPPAATLPPAQNGAAGPVVKSPVDSAAPAGPIDTFETGTVPAASNETPGATAPSEEIPATVAASVAYASVQPAVETEAPEASTPNYIGGLDVVGAAAGLAPFGPTNSATDVFDAETIRAAASTAVAGTTEEGGANLLERIFDKVKDLLFESGPSASPVQLPQTAADPTEASLDLLDSRSESVMQSGSDELLAADDDDPDDVL